jgi:hypothetical protein
MKDLLTYTSCYHLNLDIARPSLAILLIGIVRCITAITCYCWPLMMINVQRYNYRSYLLALNSLHLYQVRSCSPRCVSLLRIQHTLDCASYYLVDAAEISAIGLK